MVKCQYGTPGCQGWRTHVCRIPTVAEIEDAQHTPTCERCGAFMFKTLTGGLACDSCGYVISEPAGVRYPIDCGHTGDALNVQPVWDIFDTTSGETVQRVYSREDADRIVANYGYTLSWSHWHDPEAVLISAENVGTGEVLVGDRETVLDVLGGMFGGLESGAVWIVQHVPYRRPS